MAELFGDPGRRARSTMNLSSLTLLISLEIEAILVL